MSREKQHPRLGEHPQRRGERGQELIEFAFASVIFFVMIFGILEFGLAIWNYNLVSDLAQEGARYAIVHGQKSATVDAFATGPASEGSISAYVNSRALSLTVTTTTPLGAPSGMVRGDVVEVQVVHNLSVGGGLLPFWNFPIRSNARMIVAR